MTLELCFILVHLNYVSKYYSLFFFIVTYFSLRSIEVSYLFDIVTFLITLELCYMNSFCSMVDRRKAFSLISSREHCQRSSRSQTSDTPQARFEPAQNLSSGLVEWSCGVVITTTPPRRLSHVRKLLYNMVMS